VLVDTAVAVDVAPVADEATVNVVLVTPVIVAFVRLYAVVLAPVIVTVCPTTNGLVFAATVYVTTVPDPEIEVIETDVVGVAITLNGTTVGLELYILPTLLTCSNGEFPESVITSVSCIPDGALSIAVVPATPPAATKPDTENLPSVYVPPPLARKYPFEEIFPAEETIFPIVEKTPVFPINATCEELEFCQD
jgi:hypothetical protein